MEHFYTFLEHHPILATWLIAVVACFAYFLPSITASGHRHRYANAIFVLNLTLGWTVLGWIGALIWAYAVPPASAEESTRPNTLIFARLLNWLIAIGCAATIYVLVVDSERWDAWKVAGVTAAGLYGINSILGLLERRGVAPVRAEADRDKFAENARGKLLPERRSSELPGSPIADRTHSRFYQWRRRVHRWGSGGDPPHSYDELVAARQDLSIAEVRQGLLFIVVAWTFAGALVLFLVAARQWP